jgi:hypothetical protein
VSKDLTQLPLSKWREILHSVIKKSDHIDLSAVSDKASSGFYVQQSSWYLANKRKV